MTNPVQGGGYPGQAGLGDANSLFNAVRFLVQQLLAETQTAALVQVKAVTGVGVNPVGTVDVLPLVNMTDGQGTAYKHSIIHALPYIRIQGGANAIICDPVVGDFGLAIICNRDISVVKSQKQQSNPGSYRKFDWADGIYLGGTLGAAPQQYVQFTANGITIVDKNGNTIVTSADGVSITAPTTTINGNLVVTGTIKTNSLS